MSLFLIEQSLVGAPVMFAKLAVIGGSTLAAMLAAGVLMTLGGSSGEPHMGRPGPGTIGGFTKGLLGICVGIFGSRSNSYMRMSGIKCFNMFLGVFGAKPCRIIGKSSQKIMSRPNTCKICEKCKSTCKKSI